MRLATFNLLHGRSLRDGTVDAARLRAAISTLDLDVLGIQEVDRAQPRSGGLDLTAEIADAMGATAYRFVPAVIGTPGVAWRAATAADEPALNGRSAPGSSPNHGGRSAPDESLNHGDRSGSEPSPDDGGPPLGEPAYGIGLISRWPVTGWQVLRLPASRLRSPVLIPGRPARVLMLDDEPRVVLAATVDTPAGPVTVATTHLSFVPGWNAHQLRLALAGLAAMAGPRVLLGDLNLPAWAVAAVSPWRSLARIATYPTHAPRIQFDHVLTDATPAERALPPVVGVETPTMPLSDHRPLVVTLASPDRRKNI